MLSLDFHRVKNFDDLKRSKRRNVNHNNPAAGALVLLLLQFVQLLLLLFLISYKDHYYSLTHSRTQSHKLLSEPEPYK